MDPSESPLSASTTAVTAAIDSAAGPLNTQIYQPQPSNTPAPSNAPPSLHIRLSMFNAASCHWRSIDLNGRRALIDSQALAMVDAEERAVNARRALAEQTKAFKRLDTSVQVEQVGPLIRAYQDEINSLTTRAKTGEQAFLALYKVLHDAPDPYVLFSAASIDLDRLAPLEESLRASATTIAEYEAEFSTLKSQDVTVRRLEHENRNLLNTFEQRIATAAEERTADARAQVDEARRSFTDREKQLRQRIETLKEQLAASMSEKAHLQAASLDASRRVAESDDFRLSVDADLLERDLDQSRHDLARSQREIADLRMQLTHHTSREEANAIKQQLQEEVHALQVQLDQSDSLVRQLQSRIEQLNQSSQKDQLALATAEERHAAIVASLRRELDDRPSKADFVELRRQLHVLESLEFGSSDSSEPGTTSDTVHGTVTDVGARAGATQPSHSHTPSLSTAGPGAAPHESILLAKTRRLDSELTRVKRELEAMQATNETATKEIDTLRQSLTASNKLTAKLESDLLEANSHLAHSILAQSQSGGGGRPGKSSDHDFLGGAASLSLLTPAGAKMLAGGAVSAGPPDSVRPGPVDGGGGSAAAGDSQLAQSASMITLVLHQRDRYKAKVEQLEADGTHIQAQLDKAKHENQVLKQDNLKLYEQMQYLKSLSHTSAVTGVAPQLIGGGTARDIESGMRTSAASASSSSSSSLAASAELKYSALYEARLNPFAAFKANARLAREQALSTSERMTLAIGRAIFSKKITRTILFGYALMLHVLVMTVLWKETISPHCASSGGGKGGAHQH